jgi:hypothetical protein
MDDFAGFEGQHGAGKLREGGKGLLPAPLRDADGC